MECMQMGQRYRYGFSGKRLTVLRPDRCSRNTLITKTILADLPVQTAAHPPNIKGRLRADKPMYFFIFVPPRAAS